MTYHAVLWHHQSVNEPIELISELDENRWEIRKIERFADGRLQFADAHRETGGTRLGLEPWPPLEQIENDPEFSPRIISQSEFESIWKKATGS